MAELGLVEKLSAAASQNPGVSLFAGPKGLSEEQQLERLGQLMGQDPDGAPVVAAPVATEQPKVETPLEVTPEVKAPEVVEPARMAVPAVDLEALQREMMEAGVDEETAQKLAKGPIGRLAQATATAAAETEKSRVDRIVAKYGTVYPELKKPGVMEMLAPSGSDEASIVGRMHVLFGNRKAVMQSEVEHQMTPPGRKVEIVKPKTDDEIAFAAFAEYHNSGGNFSKAMALKQELQSGR